MARKGFLKDKCGLEAKQFEHTDLSTLAPSVASIKYVDLSGLASKVVKYLIIASVKLSIYLYK